MTGTYLKRFQLVFWVELLTIITGFLWLNYMSKLGIASHASWLWLLGLIGVLLILWVVSRVFIWWLLVEKGPFCKAVLIGIPFIGFSWLLMGFFLWCGYLVLSPVLVIPHLWLAYIIAYAIVGLLLAPAIFAVSGVGSLAFFDYLNHGKYDWFLFGIPLVKQKNLNTLVYFVKQVYIIGAGFVMLTLISQLAHLLPLAAELVALAIMVALFLAWSKLHMLRTVLSK